MAIHIETERLVLRDWRDADLAPFAAMNADDKVMEHYPATLSRAQSDAFADRCTHFLAENGFGLFAVETKSARDFIGYVGFSRAAFPAPFTPAMEIAWRLAFGSWRRGYATEAATACLTVGFSDLGFDELVSFTTRDNKRSVAVMERLGMSRNPDDDFEHPMLPAGHRQRPHVLYRITNPGAPHPAHRRNSP